MPVLQTTDIPDLIESTLEDLGRFKLTDHTTDLVEFLAFNRLMRESQVRSEGGSRIRVNLMFDQEQNSRFRGYYSTDGTLNRNEVLTHGFVDWRSADFKWFWDEEELDVNAGESQIQDYIKVKRQAALMGWAQFIEDWWWNVPPSVSDTVTPSNLRLLVTKSTTTADGAFNGGPASGYTLKGPFNPVTYPRWKNWTYSYVDVIEDDLIRKMRRMVRKTNFQPPVGINNRPFTTGDRYEHFVNESTLNAIERLGEKRNDNLGYDFAANVPTFNRANILYAPKLDDDTDNPIYHMNWGAMKTVYLRGKWMRERRAMQAPFQHTVWVVWVDSRFQMINYDPRKLAVGVTAAANP
jgi:hypothetical protein